MQFERLTYAEFLLRKYGPMDGLKTARILSCPEFQWKNVVTIGGRPSECVRRAFLSELLEVMYVVVRKSLRPNSLLLVPYQREPPEVVAKVMLFFVWCVHHLTEGNKGFHRPIETRIVDLCDVSIFHELAGPRNAELRDFIQVQLRRFWWSGNQRLPTTFDIV